jgi:hypothetical protein
LAGFDEALIEGFEGGAVLDGAQGGVQERFLDAGSGRADGPPRAGLTAVARVRCMARETGELALRQGASTGRFDRAPSPGRNAINARALTGPIPGVARKAASSRWIIALALMMAARSAWRCLIWAVSLGGRSGRWVWAVRKSI